MVNNDKLIRQTKYKHNQLCDIYFVASNTNVISDLHPEYITSVSMVCVNLIEK